MARIGQNHDIPAVCCLCIHACITTHDLAKENFSFIATLMQASIFIMHQVVVIRTQMALPYLACLTDSYKVMWAQDEESNGTAPPPGGTDGESVNVCAERIMTVIKVSAVW